MDLCTTGSSSNTAASADPPGLVERFVERLLARLFHDRFLRPSLSPAPPAASQQQQQQPQPPANPHATPGHHHHHLPRPANPALAAFALSAHFRSDPSARAPQPTTAAGMPQQVVFCVEDTVSLKHDRYSVGVVDRAFGDIDSHSPRPQRDYGEDIERHPDIPTEKFDKFMKTGIPPRGTVLISWQTSLRTELIQEANLDLLDRALYVGDVVKRDAKHPMSGTVIGTEAVCTLFPATIFNSGHFAQSLLEQASIRGVPADELINVHEYVEGALVVYEDWIGRIEHAEDEVAVKLSNNSVVVVENPEELHNNDPMLDRMSVGDMVETEKWNLRRGRWRYGAFDPHVRPKGMVVQTRTTEIDVHWISRRFGTSTDEGSAGQEPPTHLYTDDLENARFYIYDASRCAATTLPGSGAERTYHVTEVAVGDRVRFKDLDAAALKYDGTNSHGKVTKLPRTESLGYDMNVYLVMSTQTKVTVQWQDLTVTEDQSISLIPDPNVEDEDEVWPGEIICTKFEQRPDRPDDVKWTFKPAKVGIVQSVNSRDRIATVRWFANPNINFWADDLIPPSETGALREETEDVSLYDIKSTPSLTRRRGDFVLIHPDSIQSIPGTIGPDWFGEVIDLGLDGKVVVRVGAAKPVVDVRVSPERVTLVYSSDMDDTLFNMAAADGDSEDDSEEDDGSDFDTASYNEMWVEYEGMEGEPADSNNEEDWSTENDDDESMPDLELPDSVETSKTTPEVHSDPDGKSPTIPGNPASNEETSDSPTPMDEDPQVSVPPQNPTTDAEPPACFVVLDSAPPSDHHYVSNSHTEAHTFMRKVAKEHKILRTSLPPGIFVRTWESRMDLIRVLMIGPSDTPYEYAPFIIDLQLGPLYPQTPPEAYFHSWTNGNGPVNPNLYEDGKICLSLLGTWHADERNEGWSPTKSTLLQVLVSIMGLVLVKEPYYNEAGYDVHREAPETKLSSALYTERAYFRSRAFIVHALTTDVLPFADELRYLYRRQADDAPRLLDRAIEASKAILQRSEKGKEEGERDGLRRISLGAVVMLRRQVVALEGLRDAER